MDRFNGWEAEGKDFVRTVELSIEISDISFLKDRLNEMERCLSNLVEFSRENVCGRDHWVTVIDLCKAVENLSEYLHITWRVKRVSRIKKTAIYYAMYPGKAKLSLARGRRVI